ncbi:hypothetical protein TI05_11750 [Achromatium sp. WMS3]|nr:hypothetical protein TI05_11750 [Achromatium sp. WMS3]
MNTKIWDAIDYIDNNIDNDIDNIDKTQAKALNVLLYGFSKLLPVNFWPIQYTYITMILKQICINIWQNTNYKDILQLHKYINFSLAARCAYN